MKKVLLIDGNALMYKSFFASSFFLEQGQGLDAFGNPINALRTFSTMIYNLTDMFKEHHMLVAFDARGVNTYRSQYDFYKAGRSKTPQELIYQKPLIEEALDLAGIDRYSSVDYEADDIIGILAKKFANEDIIVDIITSDKDLLQLVDVNVNVHISKTGVSEMIEYNKSNFSDLYFGLTPEQVKDMKGIMGDSSDNLPGIKGIGEKGAVKLLLEHNSLEGVIEAVDSFTPAMKNKIIEGMETGILCKEIATIITEGELEIDFEQLKVGPADKVQLIGFLRNNSIHGLATKLEQKWSSH